MVQHLLCNRTSCIGGREIRGDYYMLEQLEVMLQTLPSKALDLAVRVLITVIVFIVGMKLIKLVRRILRKSLAHAEAEVGLIQFLDSFLIFYK